MRFIIFFVAFCPCILNIYGRLVRCNVSTDLYDDCAHKAGTSPFSHLSHPTKG